MVPIRKEIPQYMYIVRPLKGHLWVFLFFSVIYIGLIMNTFDRILQNNGSFGKAFLNAIAFILNIPATFRLSSVHWKQIIGVYINLLILGFVLTNYYTTLLASFMTTTVFNDDLHTVDDLVAAGIPVMVQTFDADRLFTKLKDTDQLRRILKIVSPEEYNEHRNKFNQSFAYPVASDKWNFFAMQQKYSDRPMFRYSDICTSRNLPVSYIMAYDSHLQESLKDFILRVWCSGLNYYWITKDFEAAIRMGEMKRFHNHVGVRAVTLETLLVAWLMLAVGLTLSAIAFAVEFFAQLLGKKTI